MMEHKVKRVSTIDEFERLEPEWSRLLEASGADNTFLTHAWMREWLRVFGDGRELWLLHAQTRDGSAGILPLVLEHKRGGLRRVTFMGAGEILPDHLDLIAVEEKRQEVASAFWSHLWDQREDWDLLELSDLAGDSALCDALASKAREKNLRILTRISSKSPFARLPDSFEDYLRARGSKTRQHLRQAQRALQRLFPGAQFKRVETSIELERVFETHIRLHRARWLARGSTYAFARARFTEFHRGMARAGLKAGALRLYYLELDKYIAATIYCYRAGERVMYYNSGFDEQFSQYQIGKILLAHAIEQSIAEGAREFDFLQGVEPYKEHWATGARTEFLLRVAAPHWRGQMAWARVQSLERARGVAQLYLSRETRRRVRRWLQAVSGNPG